MWKIQNRALNTVTTETQRHKEDTEIYSCESLCLCGSVVEMARRAKCSNHRGTEAQRKYKETKSFSLQIS